MSDLIKYNPDDPLFDETRLENLYKENYKEFHKLSNYFKESGVNIYRDKFLPIIVRKTTVLKLQDKFDKFDSSYKAELIDNKIEFSREWTMDLQLRVFKLEKRMRLDIIITYKGSIAYLKFNKKESLGIKINGKILYIDPFYTHRGSIGAGQFMVSGIFEIDFHLLKEIIYSDPVEIRAVTEAGNFDFELTYATKYGLEKYYEKFIKAIEENLEQ